MVETMPALRVFLLLSTCALATRAQVPPNATPHAPARAQPAGLLVSSRGADVVLRYDLAGQARGVFASDAELVRPVGITFGPDGNLYVAVGDTEKVLRFDGKTGRSRGVFTSGAEIQSPRNLNFGPDGGFYVADGFLNRILRFDGKSGAFDRVFVEDPALRGPTSFTFGPDGNLYVASVLTDRVLRFDGTSGELIDVFAATGLLQPHDVSFGPEGDLYVTNSNSTVIQRFRGSDGTPLGPFVDDPALNRPLGMAWGQDGNLYVANQLGHEVRFYDGVTGASLGALVPPNAGGLTAPAFLAFVPASKLTLGVLRDSARGGLLLRASGARPGARVLFVRGRAGGTSKLAQCPKLRLSMADAVLAQTGIADESGNALGLLTGPAGTRVALIAVDASRCVGTKPLQSTLP